MSFRSESDWAIARLSRARGRDAPFLTRPEYEAGERLRMDFERGRMAPSVTQRWDTQPTAKGGARQGADLSDTAIDARARLAAAIEAAGPELKELLLDVVCHLKGLEEVERERRWPARSAKMLLKVGLAILARHYGLAERPAGRAGALRSWRDTDARPAIGGGR
ncbi:hypothetical protein DYI37_04990 [Fulvimarina endophytica]|uniref:DUF6456 domain-containing protein n=1 Tax=Fulvimarina endophytica TaxID=2293836 RepID=A0A371X7Z9_9HYPH|nr:DUF6456 domain-containing protein [Fulvimarina endophytica]RFC65204.1 hypothetical protein DYI37_04990 [Fulvimarina endophytica]